MSLVAECTDGTTVAGQSFATCTQVVWVESSAVLDASEVGTLAAASLLLFAIAFGYRIVRRALS